MHENNNTVWHIDGVPRQEECSITNMIGMIIVGNGRQVWTLCFLLHHIIVYICHTGANTPFLFYNLGSFMCMQTVNNTDVGLGSFPGLLHLYWLETIYNGAVDFPYQGSTTFWYFTACKLVCEISLLGIAFPHNLFARSGKDPQLCGLLSVKGKADLWQLFRGPNASTLGWFRFMSGYRQQ